MACHNLPAMDVDGSSDPYIVFACDPPTLLQDDRPPKDRKGKEFKVPSGGGGATNTNLTWPTTTYMKKNLNPVWKEQVKVHVPAVPQSELNGALLLLTVMDYDMTSQDDSIGVLQLNLQDLVTLSEKETCKTIHIKDRRLVKYGRPRGTIQLTVDVCQEDSEHGAMKSKPRRGGAGGLLSRLSKQWSSRKAGS
jgi:hypothetical protein